MELLTAAQMRAIEQAAIESGRVTGLELMERAGHGVVEAVLEEWPHFATTPHRAVVLCGPGNNGGDGFVVARLLRERGWDVEVFLYGEVEKLPPDAKVNAERWLEMAEVELVTQELISRFQADEFDCFDCAFDALFGTGLNRNISELAQAALETVLFADTKVAIDIASGICADSGRYLGDPGFRERDAKLRVFFPADLTVTFENRRVGHVLSEGLASTFKLVTKRIGISHRILRWYVHPRSPIRIKAITRDSGVLKHIHNPHKYSHGHALILAGGVGKGGAARLAARGALRIGAGLVTVAPPPAALIENAAQLNAIMLKSVRDADALADALKDTRINALCLGPGLGVDRARALVPAALSARRATVLDADALTAFAEDPQTLFNQLHNGCVLTPHMGEFGRLFPDIKAKLDAPPETGPAYSKIDAAREAASRAGCTILLKGPDTVIADPDGRVSVNASVYERAAPWLATAGSGDVLAGYITGLLARGHTPHAAAASAAWLHTECALKFGPGLIAEDLPEQLPAVLADLEGNSP
ncbi:NAD(P)H-hydrate dehydratase [Pontivivens insulae]|uniref:Bifunctional NAD(P)H-hydrate repair enzyme n=1 Tax=Pontivivens insulae TaxID=1639689 RepID=A0A2R8ABL4_9RHOB|nr:NAD(P)H-hydrate dehydratase [Pontivivens insulae]RED11352.1 hydroxyethylthiazole kinase-like uncharacterized protein yjeF/hydroxyethylthiazole kinase-like uncharacterized protein yjeF [Pontivivens insulae]SPF29475.1 Bifunctional NAD(P)H-hydrate repair enzyme Nnr [Pontivivens insulae]